MPISASSAPRDPVEGPLADIFAGMEPLVRSALGVFARVGAVVFLLPGFGERTVPIRVRLVAALMLTWLLAPLVAGFAPVAPATPAALGRTILAEALAGLVIGLAFRLLVISLQVAGTVAAQSMSISHIFGTGVSQEAEPTISSFLMLGGVAILMAGGLHIDVVIALAGLYEVLPFGRMPDAGLVAEWSVGELARAFSLGISLALPFVAVSFAYNLALAAISRAMPQLLVVLLGVPLLVGLGLGTLWLAVPEIMRRWSVTARLVLADPLGGAG